MNDAAKRRGVQVLRPHDEEPSPVITCAVCSAGTDRVFKRHGHWIRECRACRHRIAEITTSDEHVGRVYGDHYFTEGGDGYSNYLEESELITAHGAYYGDLVNQYTRPGTVLDIGSAAGYILRGLTSRGWRGMGVEPNATMVRNATSMGLHVELGSFESLHIQQQFDLITMVQVAAHFYDVRSAFKKAALLTKPGGYWLVETWNKDSFMARVFGQNWHHYCPPSVINWFTPDTLRTLAAQFGLEEVSRGRPRKKLKASHFKSFISYKLAGSRVGDAAGRVMNFIPNGWTIPYPSYDLFWMLFVARAVS